MQSMYCAEPFTIEPVKVISEHNGRTRVCPNLTETKMDVEMDYLNDCTGLNETAESVSKLLEKMAYTVKPSSKDKNLIEVSIPPVSQYIIALRLLIQCRRRITDSAKDTSRRTASMRRDGGCGNLPRLQQSSKIFTKQICNNW